MKKIISLSLAVLLAFVAGCQATPDKPVVVQKDMQQMIEKGTANSEMPTEEITDEPAISYAELCTHYGVPEKFQTTITEGSLTINCDVAIELPNTLKMPMARVVAGRFSQEPVYALFNALCGDTPMYLSPRLRDKAYYEQVILEYQADLSTETEKDAIESYKSQIESMQELYEKAPENLELTPCDGTLQNIVIEGDETGTMAGTLLGLDATADPYNLENPMTLCVQNDIDYTDVSMYSWVDEYGNTQIVAPRSGSKFEFLREGYDKSHIIYCQNGIMLADVTAMSLSGGEAENCLLSTTPKQARDIVETLLTQAGIDDMMIDTICLYSCKRNLKPEYIEHLKEVGRYEEVASETNAYVFRLLRQLSGVKTESTHLNSETSTDQMSFGAQWYYEELTIIVDDEGIANVYWMAPLEVEEVITEDTAILPFSDIEDIFEKMIVIGSGIYVESDRKQQIDITRASLSLQRIMEQDSYTTGLLVPVWNFYGSTSRWSDDGEKQTSEIDYRPLISINAIDGSVIDTQKGY